MKKILALIAALVVLVGQSFSQNTLFDTVSGGENAPWVSAPDNAYIYNSFDAVNGAVAQRFVGDGNALGEIETLVRFRSGDNSINHAPTGFDGRLVFATSEVGFNSDPFGIGVNGSFSLSPISATLVGQSGGESIWSVKYNPWLAGYNISTGLGEINCLSIMTDGDEIMPGVIGYAQLSYAPTGGGLSAFYANSFGNGPGALETMGISTPFAAMRITTVPEPSTLALGALGLGVLAFLKAKGRRSI